MQVLIIVFVALLSFSIAIPTVEASDPVAVPHLSGGIGKDEREELARESHKFNLKIQFASKNAAAFVADVQVVLACGGTTLLEANADGPWFFAKLPAGKCAITATFEGERLEKSIAIPKTGQAATAFYFNVPDHR